MAQVSLCVTIVPFLVKLVISYPIRKHVTTTVPLSVELVIGYPIGKCMTIVPLLVELVYMADYYDIKLLPVMGC